MLGTRVRCGWGFRKVQQRNIGSLNEFTVARMREKPTKLY